MQEVLANTDGLWMKRKEQKPAPGVQTLKSRLEKLIKAAKAAVSNKTKGTGTGGKNAKEDWMELALEIQGSMAAHAERAGLGDFFNAVG